MPSKESLERAQKWVATWTTSYAIPSNATAREQELADLLDEAIREARVSEHRLTCHKPLLQYDGKGKLTGNLRCGEGWECARLAQLEKR